MLSIKLADFLKESILNENILLLNWHIFMFTKIADKQVDNEYIRIDDKNFYIKLDGEEVLVTDKYDKPLLSYNDKLEVNKSFLVNVNNPITTTVGRLLLNYLIGTDCFNNKIEYINSIFTFKEVEKLIAKIYDDDDKDGIHTDEYKEFLNMRLFIDTFANYVTVGVTEHSLLPAPGIEKFIEKTIKDLVKEYGNDRLNNDPLVFKKLEDAAIAYDTEYLKNDIAYGKIITKKVVTMSRKRMYALFGLGNNLKTKPTPIFSALSKGLRKDGIELSGYFNEGRFGSFSRGDATKNSGALTKFLIRATSDVVIDLNDCKTKLTLVETITADNKTQFIKSYISVNDKIVLLTKDNIDSYINKKVNLRDPFYCKSDTGLCIICAGERFRDYTDFMPLLATTVGGNLLAADLARFHSTALVITDITPEALS